MTQPIDTPRVSALLTPSSAVFTAVTGTSRMLEAEGDELRDAVVHGAVDEARRIGSSVELVTSGAHGEHRILVAEDGALRAHGPAPAATRSAIREQAWWLSAPAPAEPASEDPPRTEGAADAAAGPADESTEPVDDVTDPADSDVMVDTAPAGIPPVPALPASVAEFAVPPMPEHPLAATGAEAAPDDGSGPAARSGRPTFITPSISRPMPIEGWRGVLARMGFPIGPSRAQIERVEREQTVSLQWAGCRTIAVANGKGGVGKTMSTAMLAAVFARHGGGNVLAWDNNDTRGTLGWRTEQGLYDTTIRDLLPEAPRLLEPTSSVSEIARFVHHQATDRYDVLRSNPELLATDQRIDSDDFDMLMKVAARYYRLVIFDSGNDESADRWLRMIDSSYHLVVPTLAAPESAESAALLLDALRRRDEHSKRLADQATVIVSQSERSNMSAVNAIAEKFAGHVRAVEIIPFDHGLKSGPLRFDGLAPATQDAWVRAAAAVARSL